MGNKVVKTKEEILSALKGANITPPNSITKDSLKSLFIERKNGYQWLVSDEQINKFISLLGVSQLIIKTGSYPGRLFFGSSSNRTSLCSFISEYLSITKGKDTSGQSQSTPRYARTKSQIRNALSSAYIGIPATIDKNTIVSLLSSDSITHKQIGLFFYHLGLISSPDISAQTARSSWAEKFALDIVISDEDEEGNMISEEINKSTIDITFDRIQEIYQQMIIF